MQGGMISGWGTGFGIFGWLIMVLFWALVIVGIVLAARWLMGEKGRGPSRSQETALDILKKRYASGEIDREQYEAMKKDLE